MLKRQGKLTLILLTWTKWWAPASASEWRMGFNSAFKGLTTIRNTKYKLLNVSNMRLCLKMACKICRNM
jgi:hypothetical protein